MRHSLLTLIAMGLMACGCSGALVSTAPPWPEPEPTVESSPPPQAAVQSTSLWKPAATLTRAYDDHRARYMGDVVTVIVIEQSEASRSASTDLSRGSSVDAGINTFLGAPDHYGLPNLYKSGGFSPTIGAETENSFAGSGSSKRKDSLTTSIAARVVEILHDGNLVLEGRRQVEVNDEVQYLYVKGIARPVDISPHNTITSVALADARVIYSGEGLITRQQRPGWLYQIVDAIWPF